jgi:hypothetical protein
VKGYKFFVTVRRGTHYFIFDMVKNEGLWIIELEDQLADAIVANLA